MIHYVLFVSFRQDKMRVSLDIQEKHCIEERMRFQMEKYYLGGEKMSVKSIFEFHFPAASREEGFGLAKAIGNDMPPYEGYLDHEVIRDVKNLGHLQIVTRWGSREQADAVLAEYIKNPKIQQITELHSGPPSSFVGEVIS